MAGSPKKRARREAATAAAKAAAGEKMAQVSSPMGRPSIYTRELADDICARIAAGETLTKICSAPGMPTDSIVRKWAQDDLDGFQKRYYVARDLSYDALEDKIRDAAYDDTTDFIADGETGIRHYNNEAVQRSRLKVETDKWILSKRRPSIFGDRIGISGVADAPPVQVADASPRELARVVLALISDAQRATTDIDGEATALGGLSKSLGGPRGMFGAPSGIDDAELVPDDAPAVDEEIDLADFAPGDLATVGELSIEFDRLDPSSGDPHWYILDAQARRVAGAWGTAKATAMSRELAATGKLSRGSHANPAAPSVPSGPLQKATRYSSVPAPHLPEEMPFPRKPPVVRRSA